MAATIPEPPKLRDTPLKRADGTYDWDSILGRELYPIINQLRNYAITVNETANRWIPRFASGTSVAILDTDENALICTESAVAVNVTFDPTVAETFEDGTVIGMVEYGGGQITVVPTLPLVINTAETLKTRKQHAIVCLIKLRDDEWMLTGDMELF